MVGSEITAAGLELVAGRSGADADPPPHPATNKTIAAAKKPVVILMSVRFRLSRLADNTDRPGAAA